MIHLSVAIGRFVETLLWALIRAGLSLAGVAVLIALAAIAAMLIVRNRLRRKRPRG